MDNKSIQIYVALKHMGNVTKKVKEYPFLLSKMPRTFRELIEESVKSCIDAYKIRANNAKNPTPLTDEQFDGKGVTQKRQEPPWKRNAWQIQPR